ncbi:MAG TPA: aromatic ring-hydroxylating dioxygenase subunit alpha [Stellaceae bacterium]|nr:aromatic ring-hydroxylating dioxygenase subunit alpha [Stellaceae bacterium]
MATGTAPRQIMPAEAYVSMEWFRREQAELFSRCWVFAGMTEDLKAPGDYQVIATGRASLILLRDAEGGLRAFHNNCRHRGTRLLEGKGNVGRAITCFYHSWSYDLAGRLKSVTLESEQFPGIDKSCLGLKPASVATWRNLVFVNPDPAAEPLERWLSDIPQKLGPFEEGETRPHDPERLVEVADVVYRVRANWKIIVENFIDGYHLPLLHPISLGDGDFMKQHWEAVGRHQAFYRPLKPGISHNDRPLPVIEGLPANYGASYQWLFPNLGLYNLATFWSTFHVIPLEAGLSLVQSRIRAMPEALERAANWPREFTDLPPHIVSAKGPYAEARDPFPPVHPTKSNNVMLEDIYACEAVQAGLEAGGTIGPLSRWERPLEFFQRQVLDYVAV